MFLLVQAYPGCPVPKAVKRLCVFVCECYMVAVSVLKWSDGDMSDPSIDSYSQMQPVCHSSRTLLAGID